MKSHYTPRVLDGVFSFLCFVLAIAVLTTAHCAALGAGEQCLNTPPAQGWVCQDGGWLPPGHPALRVEPPPPAKPDPNGLPLTGASTFPWPPAPTADGPNKWIIEAAKRGEALPPGDVFFAPPLVLRDVALLKGTAGRTVLKPLTTTAGPLIIIEKVIGGDYSIQYPLMTRLEGFRLVGFPGQTGIVVRGGLIVMQDLVVANCDTGMLFEWAVNVAVRDSLITGSKIGLDIVGLAHEHSITTLRFSGVRVAKSTLYGARILHGMGVVFDDSSVFENNSGTALFVQPRLATTVLLRDTWFEQNGVHISDPYGAVRREGVVGWQ